MRAFRLTTKQRPTAPYPPKARTAGDWLPAAVIVSLILGLAFGVLLRTWPHSPVASGIITALDVIGTMWMNAIRMTVIPLIVPLLIAAVAGARSGRAVGNLGLYTGALFLGMVTMFAVISALVSPLIFGHLHLEPSATVALRASVAATPLPAGDASVTGWFKNLIPTNPIRAAADGTMLPLVVFALMFGFATLAATADIQARVIAFCHTLRDIMLILIQAVLKLAPLGVFALTAVVGAKLGRIAFGALSFYISVVSISLLIGTLALCALAVVVGRLSLPRFFSGASPAQLTALSTSSSLASLPAMIEGAREQWALREDVIGFVLALAVSTFKPASAISFPIIALFVATLYGIHLSPAQIILIAAYVVLMNPTVPGIPSGGFIVIAPLFTAVGLPLEGVAVTLAVAPITDRFSTLLNVTADMAVAAVLGQKRVDERT